VPAEPIRVLTLIESLGRGGAERWVVTLDRHLDRTRFTHHVVSLFNPNPLAEELKAQGTEVTCYGLRGPDALPAAVRRLRRSIRSLRPHVVHTHLFAANVAGRIAAGGRPRVVTTLHNPDYGKDAGRGWRYSVRTLLDRATGHLLTARFLAVSQHVAQDYRDHMGFQGIQVHPNGMDVGRWADRIGHLTTDRCRRDLGVPPEAFLVLHVGRLHRQKGQDVLVRAFERLKRRVPSARLALVGVGGTEPQLRREVAKAGLDDSVHFAGQVADVTPWMRAATVFAFPSRFEAFGIALLEAMAAGLPTVVSGIQGLDEVADDSTSLFVPPGEVGQLAQALERVHDDLALRTRLGQGGVARAAAFDVIPRVRRLERVYAEEASAVGWTPRSIPSLKGRR